ncbi:hypothetical protein PUN28_003779 [Cardiocondyla obscurior]
MNIFPDLQSFDWQIHDETPLRADYPRFRRLEQVDSTNLVPRKWLQFSTPQIDENLEQRNVQMFQEPNCITIRSRPLTSKSTYAGDRFIPCRRNHNFEMAHHLLMKDDLKDTCTIDVCKQIESLETTYRRKAMHAIMVEQNLIPDKDQNKILRFNSSVRSRKLLHSEYEKGSWKCAPREKPLIGSMDKMLSLPDCLLSNDNSVDAIDWSGNDTIAVAVYDYLNVYGINGEKLSSYKLHISVSHDKIIGIKWSNDGTKLIISVSINYTMGMHGARSSLMLYDLDKNDILWNRPCSCERCVLGEKNCAKRCMRWTIHDQQIVTASFDKILLYESSTGVLLDCQSKHSSYILNLSFSPNLKYLVSTGEDKCVRVFTWPEYTSCFDIKFDKAMKALAWHPQVPDLLCIGGHKDGSLALWNVSKCEMISFVKTKFDGCVKNLVWNKLSGELVVHWCYKEDNNKYTIVAVLSDLKRIVDVLPLGKEMQLSFLKFNASYEQLVTFCYNSNVCTVWNFFGNEKSLRERRTPRHSLKRQKENSVLIYNLIR